MALNLFRSKSGAACELHGAPPRSGDRVLAGMALFSLAVIAWHVWFYGTVEHPGPSQAAPVSFPALLGSELGQLLFGKKGILAELWEVFPYFLIGILIAGYLRTFKIAVKLQASLRKYGVASVFVASFVGIISPLCACGTVTTAMSLLMAGIPLAPVMSLMVASPLLSPSTYLLTLNDLGPEWTVIRTFSALGMGIFAGLVTHLMARRGKLGRDEILIEGAFVRGDFHDDDYPDERLRCNCRRNFGNRVAVKTGNKFLVFLAKSSEMIWVVGKYVLIGVLIGAIVERYLPDEWIYRFFGRQDPLGIVWVTLASVPMFVHQISASSIIHHVKGALDGTLDGGAALAFLVGGPVTAVPTMVLFWTFFRKRVFFIYMGVCLSGTLLIAYGCQLFLFVPGVDLGNPLLKGVSSLSGGPSFALVKKDSNVRVVLAPEEKGVIAAYSDDVEGSGLVVFDASPGRFDAPSLARGETARYLANLAGWLDKDTSPGEKGKVLVYRPGNGGSPDDDRLLSDTLRARGYAPRLLGGKDAPRLSEELLADCGQLWLFFPPGEQGRLSDEELELISRRIAKGGATLVVPEPVRPGQLRAFEANRLAARFGVSFEGSAAGADLLRVSPAAGFFGRAAAWLQDALKLVNKA